MGFPTEKEVEEFWNNDEKKIIGEGAYKRCYEFSEKYVALELMFVHLEEGDEWLKICVDEGLIDGKLYSSHQIYLWIVERVEVFQEYPQDILDRISDSSVASDGFISSDAFKTYLEEVHPEWYDAYLGAKNIYHYLFMDIKPQNFGVRTTGEYVFFDICSV